MFFAFIRALKKVVNDNKDDWDKKLGPILFSLRTKKQCSTNSRHFACFTIVKRDTQLK